MMPMPTTIGESLDQCDQKNAPNNL